MQPQPPSAKRGRVAALGLVLGAVAAGLGIWQVERLQQKQALLADLAARAEMPSVMLPASADDWSAWEFRHVRVQGRYDPTRDALLLNRSLGERPGTHLLAVLQRDDAPPLVIDRGWLALNDEPSRYRRDGPIELGGTVRVARPPGWFIPANEPAKSRYFFVDPPALAGASSPPIWIELDPASAAKNGDGPVATGGSARVSIPNDHLQYALTWFALAAILFGMALFDTLRAGNRRTL